MAAVTFKEYALQDGNTLEATQIMLESRVVTAFPLNDQEILCRHLHKVAADWVDDYRARAGGGGTDEARCCPPSSPTSSRSRRRGACPTERERYAQRMSSSMDEMQAFYDACFPRAEAAIAYCDQFPLDELPDDALHLLQLLYSLVMVSFPVEAWRQPQRPRLRRRLPRPRNRAEPSDPCIGSDHGPESTATAFPQSQRRAWWSRRARRRRGRDRRRPPAVIVVEGEAHRRGEPDASDVPSPATEIDLGDVTLLPGLMDMELNIVLGGPRGGNTRPDVAGRPGVHGRSARPSNCRTTLDAGFTTVRNLGLFVKTGGYLLDVALARAIDSWLDRRARASCRRACDHPHRRAPRPDDVPAPRARGSCRCRSRRASRTAWPRSARPCATRSSTAPG